MCGRCCWRRRTTGRRRTTMRRGRRRRRSFVGCALCGSSGGAQAGRSPRWLDRLPLQVRCAPASCTRRSRGPRLLMRWSCVSWRLWWQQRRRASAASSAAVRCQRRPDGRVRWLPSQRPRARPPPPLKRLAAAAASAHQPQGMKRTTVSMIRIRYATDVVCCV